MKWNDLYKKHGGKPKPKGRRKILVICILIFVLLIGGALTLVYYYPQISGECDAVIDTVDGYIARDEIGLEMSLENSLSKICSYSFAYGEEYYEREVGNYTFNFTYFNVSSCDLDKVKNGLDNPSALSLNDLKTYIKVSDLYEFKISSSYLKDIFTNDFSSRCDQIKSLSSKLYSTIFVSTTGMTLMFKEGISSSCIYSNQTTEVEKKECLISILDAYKSTANYYSTLDYSGNVSSCALLRGINEETISLSEVMMTQVCQKMIEYKKELVSKIIENDMDYNQKYFIFVSLLLQNTYLGGEDIRTQTLERDFIDRITNPEYKAKFIELYEMAYLEEY